MLKKEDHIIWYALLIILVIGLTFIDSLSITGNASQVVAYNEVISIFYPDFPQYDIARVVALPELKTSNNYIGPYDTALYITFPKKEIEIKESPSNNYLVDITFNRENIIKLPINSLINLPYNTEVSITNTGNEKLIVLFMIDQGYRTAGYAVRDFTKDQTQMIKVILFILILICLFMIFRKKH